MVRVPAVDDLSDLVNLLCDRALFPHDFQAGLTLQ
jgi:hypothetical protein